MTILAVIQARWNSSRFPGKVLVNLQGKPILRHVIDRVRQAESIDNIVVATAGRNHGAIVGYCAAWGVNWIVEHATDPADVLSRFVCTTAHYEETDIVVRVCADNPLVWPGGIDALVNVAQKDEGAEYVGYEIEPGDPAILHPTGWFAEVVRVGALRRLDFMLSREDPEREHVTKGLYMRAGMFQCRWLPLPEWYTAKGGPPDVAIDTPDDLRRVSDWLDDQAAERNGSPWK